MYPKAKRMNSYLQHLSEEGLRQRLRERPTSIPLEAYQHRLTTELAVLNAMGYAGYFLVVWDIINFARSRKIPVGTWTRFGRRKFGRLCPPHHRLGPVGLQPAL